MNEKWILGFDGNGRVKITERQEKILLPWRERIAGMAGRRGVVEARARFDRALDRIRQYRNRTDPRDDWRDRQRRKRHQREKWKENQVRRLAEGAGQWYDEHGGWHAPAGDYYSTEALDFVSPAFSGGPPYHDLGGEGLALVRVHRERRYSRSYHRSFGPGRASTTYLVGRNESGTYYAHPVHRDCDSVGRALSWIWGDRHQEIIQRQGDIALITGRGPKMPRALPGGHRIEADAIVHDQHPPLPLPGKNQRVIIGRRAHVVVSEATRD